MLEDSNFVECSSNLTSYNEDELDEISSCDDSGDEATQLEEVTRRIRQLSSSRSSYFPDDTNGELKERIQTYRSENTRLKREVQELESQLNIVKNNSNVPKSLKGINNNDIAAGKVVELAKKVRELNAKLASAENRANKAESELHYLKENPQIKEKEEPNDQENEQKEEKIKDLTDKLNITNKKLFESRNEVQHLKHELKVSHKALASEIGDEGAVHTALTTNGWRGRAQQIIALEQKVSELTEKLSHTNIEAIEKSMMNLASSERQADKEKISNLTKEIDEFKVEIADLKNKNDAAKARIRVLSNNLNENKGKAQALSYKSTQDEQMITRLTNQLSELTGRQKEREDSTIKKLKEKVTDLEVALNQEKAKSQQFKEIIEERESRLNRLEAGSEQKPFYCPAVMTNNNNDLPEIRSVSRASSFDRHSFNSSISEMENIRLMELVTVLNKRIDEERKQLDKTTDDLRKEKQKGAKMEIKIAKMELGKVGAWKSYQNNGNSKIDVESMKDKCELLEEKCLALESRLETLRMEKEEDSRIYQHLLNEMKLSLKDQTKTPKTPSIP